MKDLEIVIHCGGMPFDSTTVYQKSLGGSETAAHYLALELARKGNSVKLFTSSETPLNQFVEEGLTYLSAGPVTKDSPLGESFHFYASSTPHDVLIIQRAPSAFRFKWASKLNLLWLHDLALYRNKSDITDALYNIDGVLCVSEFHKKQVVDTYGIPSEVVHVLNNGVDQDMVAGSPPEEYRAEGDRVRLLYISRPERGLDHLVKIDGIMEKLKREGKRDYRLYVCCYNNVAAHMKDYYENLWRKIEGMDNAHNLGFLDKPTLYRYMKSADLLVYPTPGVFQTEFVEVSCIAAMEAMHCGLPMLTTKRGALPETCNNSGTIFSKVENFVEEIRGLFEGPSKKLEKLKKRQLEAAKKYTWKASAESLYSTIRKIAWPSTDVTSQQGAGYKTKLLNSAISAIFDPSEYVNEDTYNLTGDAILDNQLRELKECYQFYPLDSYSEHYKNYYEYEQARGVDYGPEDITNNARYNVVMQMVAEHIESTSSPVIVDYGCAHGHYTISLAKKFPQATFVGVDITESNILKARKWADSEKLANVAFVVGEQGGGFQLPVSPTLIIMAEVLEHVRDPLKVCYGLLDQADRGVQCVITTPFGPWEAQGYKEHWPWRAHIHDFTKSVIKEIFGGHKDFRVCCVPSGSAKTGELMGSYVYTFKYDKALPKITDPYPTFKGSYGVLEHYAMRETLALCILTCEKDWKSLVTCLDSVKDIIDEVVVALDTADQPDVVLQVLRGFCEEQRVPLTIVKVESPLKVGFCNARNEALKKVSADWILWLDSDEVLVKPTNLFKYLRKNAFKSYSISQNHFSSDPAGIITTDYPLKLFRRDAGATFAGLIHEHPETEINKGIGHPFVLPDVSISHMGYETEGVRRSRFFRNLPLVLRDREVYKKRNLGKYFVLRDIAQLLRYHAENGADLMGYTQDELVQRAKREWREVLKTENLRLIMQSLPFYSTVIELSQPVCTKLGVSIDANLNGIDVSNEIQGVFESRVESQTFLNLAYELQTR